MSAKIKSLTPPDSHHLMAAEGWLELGNYTEAFAELELIAPLMRAHPDVLALRYQIYGQAGRWDHAFEIASTLVAQFPRKVVHWIHRSYALHELKRTREAFDLLLPAAKQFPRTAETPYNLACYECQLGNLPEAKRWLAKAFAFQDSKQTKLDALEDPDLEPLWKHIGEL